MSVSADSSRVIESWAALLVRSREGDNLAFEELLRACERRVLAIAYQITGHLEDAQDVAQESFLRVYRSRERFQDGRSFEAWLYRIVVNQARKSVSRRRKRGMRSLEETGAEEIRDQSRPDPAQSALAGDLSEKVTSLLQELSPRLRTVFVLRDLQGMETSEIAQILSRTETTVRRHSADARIRIRRLLEERYPGNFRQKAEND